MAQSQAVEVLLRPAVELYTVAVCAGAAFLCLVAPWSLALSPLLGLGSALADLLKSPGKERLPSLARPIKDGWERDFHYTPSDGDKAPSLTSHGGAEPRRRATSIAERRPSSWKP